MKERVKLNSEKNQIFIVPYTIFINYVDLSWPIEILFGIFMLENEYVQCIQYSSVQKWRTFTWTFFLCICGSLCGVSANIVLLCFYTNRIIRISLYLFTVMCALCFHFISFGAHFTHETRTLLTFIVTHNNLCTLRTIRTRSIMRVK